MTAFTRARAAERDEQRRARERDRVADEMAEPGVQERRGEDPGQSVQRARVDAIRAEALTVDLVDDLDDPHHAE